MWGKGQAPLAGLARGARHSAQWVVTQVRVARETSRTVACARNLLLVLWCTLLY